MTTEQTTALEISSVLTAIAGTNVEQDLIQTPELGRTRDFSQSRSLFDEVVQFTSLLSGFSWQKLPMGPLDQIRQQLQTVHNSIGQIENFPSTGYGENERDNYANQLRAAFDSFKQTAIPYVGFLSWDSIDLDEYQRSLLSTIEEGRESIERFSRDIQETRSEADDALREIRAAAAEAGVSQEAATFLKAANRYDTRSRWWLTGSVVSLVGTIATAIALVLIWKIDGAISDAAVLQIVLVKAATVAVLSYATVTAVRLYRSNAHLAAVNRHREDALRTFRTFVEGTDSGEVKDKILLAAANAAFGQTSTGFIGDKGDGGNTLEVLDGIGGGLIRRS